MFLHFIVHGEARKDQKLILKTFSYQLMCILFVSRDCHYIKFVRLQNFTPSPYLLIYMMQ
jgi:hypothetical protein